MFILASSSPRRKELLRLLLPDFAVVVPMVEENIYLSSLPLKDLPLEESRLKAYKVKSIYPHDEILACDTMVMLNGKALGKPKNEEEAFQMLKEESGKKQIVLSGYTYLGPKREISRTIKTEVYFAQLSDEEILSYIQKFHPLDKAGAYGIQDNASLIDHIEGSYANVMGLPIEDISLHVFRKRIETYSPNKR